MREQDFVAGDVVSLRSRSFNKGKYEEPCMTVAFVEPSTVEDSTVVVVYVEWFLHGEKQSRQFHATSLVKVDVTDS